jgi:hypothetical protein
LGEVARASARGVPANASENPAGAGKMELNQSDEMFEVPIFCDKVNILSAMVENSKKE